MEQKYLTIREAMAHTGKAEETLRRWIRSVRNQFEIDLDDTNEQLEQKTPLLRKQNESTPMDRLVEINMGCLSLTGYCNE